MTLFGLNSWTISFDATLITIILLSFFSQSRINKTIANRQLTERSQLFNTKFYYSKELSLYSLLMCLPIVILTSIAFFNPSVIGPTGPYHLASLVIMIIVAWLASWHFANLVTTNYIELTPEAFIYTVQGTPKTLFKDQIQSIDYSPYGKSFNLPRIQILYRKTHTRQGIVYIETDHYALPGLLLLDALNHWWSNTELSSTIKALNT